MASACMANQFLIPVSRAHNAHLSHLSFNRLHYNRQSAQTTISSEAQGRTSAQTTVIRALT